MSDRERIFRQIAANRAAADAREIEPVRDRIRALKRLLRLIRGHLPVMLNALYDDLGKSDFEAMATEIYPLISVLKYMIRRLPRLAAPKRVGVSVLNFPARGKIVQEPYGQVLIVTTWNYPLLLTLEPVIGAYAAGTRVVVKLSKRATHSMHFLRWLLEECFQPGRVLVIDNELDFSEVLAERFDYIFFTGSQSGGREVLAAAAPNLTPVTLELGGKNPCIVDESADLRVAAKRIVWGKFSNAGQACAAPDYLLVNRRIHDGLMHEIARAIRDFYGNSPLDSPDYPSIIDADAYQRLSRLAGHGRLVAGGETSAERLMISPTVLDRIDAGDELLSGEFFGPLLPVAEFVSTEELFMMLKGRGKPLALYYFGTDRKIMERLIFSTSSGAVVFNDVMTHFINPEMPFGGVGASGMGAYHGRRTFETFSHAKPVMKQSAWFDWPFRYPPYGGWRKRLLERLCR